MRVQFRPEGGTGCEYYRCELPAKALRDAGHDVTVDRGIKVLKTSSGAQAISDRQVVIWQRPMSPEDVSSMEITSKYLTVVDLDDDLLALPAWNPMQKHMQDRGDFTAMDRLKTCMRAADLITVTTPELAEVVRPFAKSVTVLPNHIDVEKWRSVREAGSRIAAADHHAGRLRVGWAGWMHTGDLDVLHGTIEPVLRRHNAKLVLIGWLDARLGFDLPDSMVELVDWSPIGEYEAYVASLDIGLAPLADTRFNSCKSHIKVLEYMAAGVVPIASATHPDYARLITRDQNGLLADRPKKWAKRLDDLLGNERARLHMLEQCERTIEKYDLPACGEAWRAAYATGVTEDDHIRNVRGVGVDKPKLISVVIPVLNELALLKRCVAKLKRTVKNMQLIIVDNASDAKTALYCEQVADVYLRNETNVGFARACNMGILHAVGDLYVLINSDTVPATGWIKAVTQAFADDPNLGVANPTTNYARGAACIWNIHGKDFDRVVRGEYIPFTDDEVERTARLVTGEGVELTEELSGFCLIVRPQLVDQIGGMDTSFGLGGGEDRDFVYRARLCGWSAGWIKGAYVHHFGHRSMLNIFDDHQAKMEEADAAFDDKFADEPQDLYIPLIDTARMPVLMLTWNRLAYTKQALAALADHTFDIQVIVIDDGSDDGTQAWLKTLDYDRYKITAIRLNPQRRGVDVNQDAFNKLARGATFLAKVDNDTIVPDGWKRKLFAAMLDAKLDIVGSDHFVGVGIDECEHDREFYFDRKNSKPVTGGRVYMYPHVGGSGVIWRGDLIDQMTARGITIADEDGSVSLDRWTDYQHAATALLKARIGFYDGVFVELLDMEGDNKRRGEYVEYETLMRDERRAAGIGSE
jgi:GT2 family glycosyltransferase